MGDYKSIEQKVVDYFSSRSDTAAVTPPVTDPDTRLRNMVWGQKSGDDEIDDIRLILEFDDDIHSTDSFYFEVQKLGDKPSEGLLFSAEGKYLAYVSTQENILYIIQLPELREWVQENSDCFMVKEKSSDDNPEKKFYKNRGYLVPRPVLKKKFGKVEEVNLPT